jgi:hypothetical protein
LLQQVEFSPILSISHHEKVLSDTNLLRPLVGLSQWAGGFLKALPKFICPYFFKHYPVPQSAVFERLIRKNKMSFAMDFACRLGPYHNLFIPKLSNALFLLKCDRRQIIFLFSPEA